MEKLSPEELKRVKMLRDNGHSWVDITAIMGKSEYAVRGTLEPQWLVYRKAQVNTTRLRRAGNEVRLPPRPEWMREKRQNAEPLHVEQSFRASAEALADRDRRMSLEHASLTAALLGDPLPGRSALDKRRGA